MRDNIKEESTTKQETLPSLPRRNHQLLSYPNRRPRNTMHRLESELRRAIRKGPRGNTVRRGNCVAVFWARMADAERDLPGTGAVLPRSSEAQEVGRVGSRARRQRVPRSVMRFVTREMSAAELTRLIFCETRPVGRRPSSPPSRPAASTSPSEPTIRLRWPSHRSRSRSSRTCGASACGRSRD
jgi:hypothetical protein